MLKKARTPQLVKAVIEKIWQKFDIDKNGVLDKKEAKMFVR